MLALAECLCSCVLTCWWGSTRLVVKLPPQAVPFPNIAENSSWSKFVWFKNWVLLPFCICVKWTPGLGVRAWVVNACECMRCVCGNAYEGGVCVCVEHSVFLSCSRAHIGLFLAVLGPLAALDDLFCTLNYLPFRPPFLTGWLTVCSSPALESMLWHSLRLLQGYPQVEVAFRPGSRINVPLTKSLWSTFGGCDLKRILDQCILVNSPYCLAHTIVLR